MINVIMQCPKCESNRIVKNGWRQNKQNYLCPKGLAWRLAIVIASLLVPTTKEVIHKR
jgi:hypothetical protein